MAHKLTPAQRKTRARKHYLSALYHSVFYDRKSRVIGHDEGQVRPHEANMLIRNKMAGINAFDTGCTVSEYTHGSKVYGSNSVLHHDFARDSDGRAIVLSEVPRYQRNRAPVDMREVFNACNNYAPNFMKSL